MRETEISTGMNNRIKNFMAKIGYGGIKISSATDIAARWEVVLYWEEPPCECCGESGLKEIVCYGMTIHDALMDAFQRYTREMKKEE